MGIGPAFVMYEPGDVRFGANPASPEMGERMNASNQPKPASVRPAHKRASAAPLHLEISRPTGDPRANAADAAPVIYPLRLPPRAKSYSKSELATAAHMFTRLKRGEDLRHEKVTDIRYALEHEDYENAMKVEIAVERVLADWRLVEMN